MDLGQFSVSLAVEDLPTSRAFYNKLGFEVFNSEVLESGKGGSEFNEKWVILTNGSATSEPISPATPIPSGYRNMLGLSG